jgi:hypothetical protein
VKIFQVQNKIFKMFSKVPIVGSLWRWTCGHPTKLLVTCASHVTSLMMIGSYISE